MQARIKFSMRYRNIDRDYQCAILRGTVREYSANCVHNNVQAFCFYNGFIINPAVEFLHVTVSYIRRKSCFYRGEIMNHEDFCLLLRNGTITSAASFVATPPCDLQIFATYFDNKQLWSS